MSQLSHRRHDLYGPGRTLGRDTAKKLQQEDHIQQNFRKGVGIEQYEPRDAFQTVTAQSFREHTSTSGPPSSSWDPSAQNTTHIQLGSDHTQPLSSVLKADYCVKPVTRYKQHIPSGLYVTNIPDMATRYMSDKTVGKSLYVADFDGDKTYGVWSSRLAKDGKKVGRRQKTTLYQKNTHFELGSDPPSLETETTYCYTGRAPPEALYLNMEPTKVDRSKSSLFKTEDHVEEQGGDRFLSVQRKDFTRCPPAGVSTATSVGYSHVLPSNRSSMPALSSLRRLLIDKNIQEFQNPRDPTAINITKAFLKYDRDRSGSIDVDELKVICTQLGTPMTDEEIKDLLKECDQKGDGKLDYGEFRRYLTAYSCEPPTHGEGVVSTNADTYSARPQTADEAAVDALFTGAQYQTATHFNFGDSTGFSSSIYNQDFGCEDTKRARNIRLALPPPSSKVMHEFPHILSGSSTSRGDFVKHDIRKREDQRLTAFKTNKERHSKLAVELRNSAQYRDRSSKESTMTSSYVVPPRGTKPSLPVDPTPNNYHHLESNRALPHPPNGPIRSEIHDNFTTPLKTSDECLTKRKAALGERNSRISDNKNTHFILGFNDASPLSEKMVEFSGRPPVDPDLPAAGKPNLPTKGYPVIEQDTCSSPSADEPDLPASSDESGLQGLLQQRNFLKNINPRDPLNVNLRKAFLQYDKDLSGTISKDEVRSACREMKVGVSDNEIESIISRCDKNGIGQIDYHDFALSLSWQHHPGSTHSPTTVSTTRKDFKDPKAQRMSIMQKLVLEQDPKRYVPLQSTHFFHLDSHDSYLHSTTMKDFVRPEEQ